MRIILIFLMLLCAANSYAFSSHDDQEEIFTVRSYNYRLKFNNTDLPANEDLLFKNICKETCARASEKYEDYIANGWKTDIVMSNQLVELSPDKNNSLYQDEIRRLEKSCKGPCFECQCVGVRYVLEKR